MGTGDDDRMGRLQEVMALIQQMTQEDVRQGTSWGEPSRVEGTVIGQLGRQFLSSKAAGLVSEVVGNYYNELGKNLDSIDVPRLKRKAYRKALNVFAPTVKVKKK